MTSTENDLRFMEQTEKLVAEMLKSVLAPNCHCYGGQNGLKVAESIEYVVIDETELEPETNSSNEMTENPTNFSELVKFVVDEENQTENHHHIDCTDMNELESLISDGLDKIRLEYPIYADPCNENAYNNDNSVPVMSVSSLGNAFGNIPYNCWCNDSLLNGNDATCSPGYCDEKANYNLYGEEYWNDIQYYSTNASVVWPQSNVSLLNVTDNRTPDVSKLNNEVFENETTSDEEDENENQETNISNALPTETTVHCIMTKHDRREILCNKSISDSLIQAELSHHLSVNSDLNDVSTASGSAATTHVQICAGTPTAIHAAQSTTTTTTTSAGFGVLHHQSSCTTTNFVPNSFVNALLATSPAALYAQSILTSTAHQYLNVFRKEIQQFFTSNSNNNNWNLRIYERLVYAQLLQQQIFQQQQQQAAIASLLQQQKIALQNNAASIAAAAVAAAAAAAATAATATFSSTNICATSSSTSNVIANDHIGTCTYDKASQKSAVSNNSNKSASRSNSDMIVNIIEKKSFNTPVPEVTEDCVVGSAENEIRE